MNRNQLEAEYVRKSTILEQTGIVSPLPLSKEIGVRGFDGQEYPMPDLSQVIELFERNNTLVGNKEKQGFRELQLTPLAMSFVDLHNKVGTAVIKHQREEKMFESFQYNDLRVKEKIVPVINWISEAFWPYQVEIFPNPISASSELLMMDVNQQLVYFPVSFPSSVKDFEETPHRGFTKTEVISDSKICPVPGWSIGINEDLPCQSWRSLSETIGGRKRLEGGHVLQDYFDILSQTEYIGESGWTIEDFLISHLNRLKLTNQVDADMSTWLVGNLIPNDRQVVDGLWGFWSRLDHRLIVSTRSPERPHPDFTARTMVRLGA